MEKKNLIDLCKEYDLNKKSLFLTITLKNGTVKKFFIYNIYNYTTDNIRNTVTISSTISVEFVNTHNDGSNIYVRKNQDWELSLTESAERLEGYIIDDPIGDSIDEFINIVSNYE